MRGFRPLRVAAGFLLAYVAWFIAGIPILVVQALWFRSLALDADLKLPAAFAISLLAIRCVINFALGYYAQSMLGWLAAPREAFCAVVSLTVALAILTLVAFTQDGSASELTRLLSLAALAAGAWMRFVSPRPRGLLSNKRIEQTAGRV